MHLTREAANASGGVFGLPDQLKRLSDCGDPLEMMGRVVDFEVFRPALQMALAYGDGAKGGLPPYGPATKGRTTPIRLTGPRTMFLSRLDQRTRRVAQLHTTERGTFPSPARSMG